LWLYLKERTPLLTEPLSLLHIAPETFLGRTLRALPNIDYLSGDLESPAAMVKMDITDIQYPDASFDVILCNHVLEHVPADRQAMRELYRVLKPGGWAILQVPIDESRAETLEDPTIVTPEARQQYYGQYDHVRLYGRDYAERLSEVGFRVERDVFCQQLPSGQIGRFALQTDEAIYRCWRPL
jgi:SAM-dependent methyltransferase